ncbi:MAG: hypothetical protein ACOYT4_04010 [Nanoarchaeota archaeon]
MAETQNSQIQLLLTDFNTRLKDLEERNRQLKERILLLGKNLIFSKEEIDTELSNLKKQSIQMQTDMERIKSLVQNIIAETDKFVRKDEMMIIERMLKDFQPLEFIREKDLDLVIEKYLKKQKNIKKDDKEEYGTA